MYQSTLQLGEDGSDRINWTRDQLTLPLLLEFGCAIDRLFT